LHDSPSGYRNEIEIRSEGVPRLFTHFQGRAATEGRVSADHPPEPARYEAIYDLRKRRDRHLSMVFVARNGATFADRGAGDTSRKPPLGEAFRKNVLDPMSVMTLVRQELRRRKGTGFTIPVYDGARRFDVVARILPTRGAGKIRLDLTLQPIAGFKGETTEDGDRDPDDSPRTVELAISDDDRLMPLEMTVPVAYLPLVVQFVRFCTAAAPCPIS